MDAQRLPPESLPLFRALEEIAVATTPESVVRIVRAHLADWTAERIHRLQVLDGGWAPFDAVQRPIWIAEAHDLRDMQASLRHHCEALNAARIPLAPELMELDEFLFIAARMAEMLEKSPLQPRARARKTTALSAFL